MRAVFPLACLWVLTSALNYNTAVYDTIVRYALISFSSYCINKLKTDNDFSKPLVLQQQHVFKQRGYDPEDYYSMGGEIELHLAKYLYSADELKRCGKTHQGPKVEDSDGFFAIDHAGKSIILAFRGTASMRDYLTDFDTQTVKYEPMDPAAKERFSDCKNCKVHKGFFKKYQALYGEIFPTLEKLIEDFPDYQLVITGHSLGGSMAILTGLELAILGYNPLIIAYGSPKVSNWKLSEYMDQLFRTQELYDPEMIQQASLPQGCFRVVHKGDYVPLLPLGNNFAQTGFEFRIDKDALPHPMSSLKYCGQLCENTNDFGFNFKDLISFDWRQILHVREHSEYFWNIGSCKDIYAIGN